MWRRPDLSGIDAHWNNADGIVRRKSAAFLRIQAPILPISASQLANTELQLAVLRNLTSAL